MEFCIRNANAIRWGLLNHFVFVTLLLAADAVDINTVVAADFGVAIYSSVYQIIPYYEHDLCVCVWPDTVNDAHTHIHTRTSHTHDAYIIYHDKKLFMLEI